MTDLRKKCLITAGMTCGIGFLTYEVLRRRSLVYKISKSIISRPSVGEETRISIVCSELEWNAIRNDIVRDISVFPFLGLDTEWVSRQGNPSRVSLLQFATYTGHCVLVRLCEMDKIPTSLKEIMLDSRIVKVGVAVLEDSSKLLVDHNLEVSGCVDLRHLAVLRDSVPGKLGLQSLAENYLGVSLDKDWRLRAGNWEAQTLSPRQIQYAANDALVAINILWTLLKLDMWSGFTSMVKSFAWTHNNLSEQCILIVEQFIDVHFSNKEWRMQQKSMKEKQSIAAVNNQKLKFNSVRKSPFYHNCLLQAPDGQLLCTCDVKKAEWYVKKGIGRVVTEDPLTVRLNFEPSGRPEGKAGEYYMSVKPNICVVCGSKDSYLRKNIVPHEYRRYFPAVMKDHQSHDVLLMCVRCHQTSNMHDAELRKALAAECNAPIGTEKDVKLRDNFQLKKVKSAGRALLSAGDKLPVGRKLELENVVKEHYKVDEVTEEILMKAESCSFHEANLDYTPHSRAVVQHYLKEGGLIDLEVRWRKHFLGSMKPRHLPHLWSVNHQEERLEVKAAENRIDREQYLLATKGLDEDIDLEEYRKLKRAQLGINPDKESAIKL